MNFKIKLVISNLLLGLITIAQTPNFDWAKKIGSTDFDESTSIATDASGNVYTTGYYRGTVDFDPSVAGTVNLTSSGVQAGYILKLDANGNFVWVKDINGSFLIGPQCIKLDASGNIYITGNYNGTVDFDPGPATNTITSGTSEIFVLKLNAAGNYLWAKSMDGATGNAGYSLGVDPQGNVYTTGAFQGTTDFNPGAGTANLVSSGTQDIFLSKLDANGNYVWAIKMGGTGDDYATSNVVDALGNIYTTGHFNNTVDFDPSASTSNLISTGLNDAFVSKIDNNGLFVWAKKLGGTGNETGNSIALDASGNVYTTGNFASSAADFDPGAGTFTMTASSTGIYVSKLTNAGNFSWAKQIANGGSGKAITLDGNDNVYVTGEFLGTGDFNPDAGIDNLTAIGNFDAFITKFDNSASYMWTKQIGGTASETGLSIVTDNLNNILTTGRFIGTPNFNIGATSFTLTALGSGTYDAFIHKISQCITPLAPTNTTPLLNQTICSGLITSLSASSTGTITWYATPTGTTVLTTGNTYTPATLSAGTYTYYAEASTCTVSAMRTPITVTVNALPTIIVNSGSICFGTSFTINPTGANTYTYSGGGAIVTPTINTMYTVIGGSAAGCTNTSVSNVTVNALPNVLVSTTNSLICVGSTASLTASGALSYSWSASSTNTVLSISPTITTNYTVTGTNVNGCINNATITQSVSTCTGINNLSSNIYNLSVYPNPTNGIITITGIDENVKIEIYNSIGKLVDAIQSLNEKTTFDFSNYSNGIYFIKISSFDSQQVHKIIKH